MKNEIKRERVPPSAHDTVRHELVSLLSAGTFSGKGLSGLIGISEKEVYEHLEHVRKSLGSGMRLVITPAECRRCGFVFSKRERLRKPGRCPVCRAESISEPLFAVEQGGRASS
jgi:predicted Zn-ribbon and HTH transcriptional regulator